MNNNDSMKYKTEITNAIQGRLYCKFSRNNLDDKSLYGYPLAIIGDWCITAHVYDFFLDGFFMIRIKDLTKFTVYNQDILYSQMLINEGIRDAVDYSLPLLHCTSITELLTCLIDSNQSVMIECEKREEYFFGMIKRLTKSYIVFHYFNSDGIWDDMLDKIYLSSITRINFKNKYVNVFSKYLPPEICVTKLR